MYHFPIFNSNSGYRGGQWGSKGLYKVWERKKTIYQRKWLSAGKSDSHDYYLFFLVNLQVFFRSYRPSDYKT